MKERIREWRTTPLITPSKAIVEVDGEVVEEVDIPVGSTGTVRFESTAEDVDEPAGASDKPGTATGRGSWE